MPNQRGHHNSKKQNKSNKINKLKMDLRDDHDAIQR